MSSWDRTSAATLLATFRNTLGFIASQDFVDDVLAGTATVDCVEVLDVVEDMYPAFFPELVGLEIMNGIPLPSATLEQLQQFHAKLSEVVNLPNGKSPTDRDLVCSADWQ